MRIPAGSRTRSLAVILALVALVGLPASASAKPPDKGSDHFVEIYCDPLINGAGAATLYATVSDLNGADAYTAFWAGATGTFASQPTLERDFESAPTVTLAGSTMTGSIPLLDDAFQPAGSATFTATLSPGGAPVPIDDQFRDGNRWFRQTGTLTPLAVTGSLVMPGAGTFDLAACAGADISINFFGTNPNATVFRFENRYADCPLDFGDGVEGFLFMGFDGESDVFIDAGLFRPDGSGIAMFGMGTLTGGTIEATLEAFDPGTGDPLGTGSVSATITATGERFSYTLTNASGRSRVSGDVYDVAGTVTFPGEIVADLGACVSADQRVKEVFTNPQGPKPSGKTPRNDLPTGAIAIAPGARTSTSTRGASPASEAPFECLGDLPVGHTVWYQIAGTGGTITVDTAGSDYDTVAAVYTSPSTGVYAPVDGACVDDVPLVPVGRTLQSAVSFVTVAGTTYYIQIGGFPEAVTYGNLRVAVR